MKGAKGDTSANPLTYPPVAEMKGTTVDTSANPLTHPPSAEMKGTTGDTLGDYQPSLPSDPRAATIQIAKYLDENKQLILAILDNQNLGKMSECAQYQAQLQKNLLYLAAIADNQPQAPAARQMMPQGGMPQGGHFMPQPSYPPGTPFTPQQQQQQRQQLSPFQGHMGMRPGFMNGMHPMHPDALHGASGLSGMTNNSVDGRGSRQDKGGAESGAAADDGHRSSAPEQGNGDSEPAPGKTP